MRIPVDFQFGNTQWYLFNVDNDIYYTTNGDDIAVCHTTDARDGAEGGEEDDEEGAADAA